MASTRPCLPSPEGTLAVVAWLGRADDAQRSARHYLARLRRVIPEGIMPSEGDLLECPYVLVGTVSDIIDKLRRVRQRWGFTRFTVRDLDATAKIITSL